MRRSELFFSLILVPLDLLMIGGAFILGYFLRYQYEATVLPYADFLSLSEFVSLMVWMIPIWIAIFAFLGLYNIPIVGKRISTEAIKVFIASSTSVLVAVVALFVIREAQFSRLLLLYMWFFSFLFVFLMRAFMLYLQRYLYSKEVGLKRMVLLKNGGSLEERIEERLSRANNMGYKLTGQYDSKEVDKRKLKEIIKKDKPDIVLLTNSDLEQKKVHDLMKACLDYGVKFSFVPSLIDIVQSKTELADFFSAPIFIVHSSPLEGWGRIAKRILDIIGSIIAIVVFSPFFIILPILIKLTSKGPVFYIQKRIGRDGRNFPLYKFRSMREDADQLNDWTTENDPRITPIGDFLRKSNLDEIPQFFNVLLGHMSLVGPRPEQPKYVKEFSDSIPKYFSRHRVKSGITGWAQINGERGDKPIEDRVPYDMYYVDNWSLVFDLKIIFITIWQVLTFNNRGET